VSTARIAVLAAAAVLAPAAVLTAPPSAPAATASGTIEVDGGWRRVAPLATDLPPALTCPVSHPWLLDAWDHGQIRSEQFEPARTIDVEHRAAEVRHPTNPKLLVEVGTWEGGLLKTSATNWDWPWNPAGHYRIVLTCTDDVNRAATRPSPVPVPG
jgi:hypothetical protein